MFKIKRHIARFLLSLIIVSSICSLLPSGYFYSEAAGDKGSFKSDTNTARIYNYNAWIYDKDPNDVLNGSTVKDADPKVFTPEQIANYADVSDTSFLQNYTKKFDLNGDNNEVAFHTYVYITSSDDSSYNYKYYYLAVSFSRTDTEGDIHFQYGRFYTNRLIFTFINNSSIDDQDELKEMILASFERDINNLANYLDKSVTVTESNDEYIVTLDIPCANSQNIASFDKTRLYENGSSWSLDYDHYFELNTLNAVYANSYRYSIPISKDMIEDSYEHNDNTTNDFLEGYGLLSDILTKVYNLCMNDPDSVKNIVDNRPANSGSVKVFNMFIGAAEHVIQMDSDSITGSLDKYYENINSYEGCVLYAISINLMCNYKGSFPRTFSIDVNIPNENNTTFTFSPAIWNSSSTGLSLSTAWDKLSAQQKAYIASLYRYKKVAIRNADGSALNGSGGTFYDTILNYSTPESKKEITVYSNGEQTTDLSLEAKNAVEDIEKYNVGEALSYIQLAGYGYDTFAYMLYQGLYMPDENSSELYETYSEVMNDIFNHSYNQYKELETIVPTGMPVGGIFDDNLYGQLYGISTVGTAQGLAGLVSNMTTAFIICNSTESNEQGRGYSIAELETNAWPYLDPDNPESNDFNNDKNTIYTLRAIIALHDFCLYSRMIEEGQSYDSNNNSVFTITSGRENVESWSSVLAEYLDLYYEHKLWAFKDTSALYDNFESDITEEEPLAPFFSIKNNEMSQKWRTGFALSALHVPMLTNLYNASSVQYVSEDTEWLTDFYYRYAFYRKALYISANNTSVVDYYISGETGTTRVATFGDLLQYNRDISLYVDDNFYNSTKLQESLDKVDINEVNYDEPVTTHNQSNISSTEATGGETADEQTTTTDDVTDTETEYGVNNLLGKALDVTGDEILKNGSNEYYSEAVASNTTKMDSDESSLGRVFYDSFVLDYNAMKESLEKYEYSPKQSFAVVSAIYRNVDLYNTTLNDLLLDKCVFRSSKAVANISGASAEEYRCYMNYLMLSGIEDTMLNSDIATINEDSPIFIDIFGNIVTETGLVIIPAASNATLCGDNWSPCTIGFASYYPHMDSLDIEDASVDFKEWLTGNAYTDVDKSKGEDSATTESSKWKNHDSGSGWFIWDGQNYVLKQSGVESGGDSVTVQWETLSRNSDAIKKVFYNKAFVDVSANLYNSVIRNLIIEALRGAPIEYIDYEAEGLDNNASISGLDVAIGNMYEKLLNAIIGVTNGSQAGNSMITVPNLAFVEGVEYIYLYAFKIVFALLIAGMVIGMYKDYVVGSFSYKNIFSFIFTVVMTVASISLVPSTISYSYYQANKALLSEDMGYVTLLNYVKELDGSEVGITKVTTPETSSKFYLKLDTLEVPWYDLVIKSLSPGTYQKMSDMYQEVKDTNPMANQRDVVVVANGCYLSVDDLFDDINISYNASYGKLQDVTYASDGSVASYVSPYYVILHQLVANINAYNEANAVNSYSYGVSSDGHVVTYDIAAPFFKSNMWNEQGYDITGLNHLLNANASELQIVDPFSYDEYTDEEGNLIQDGDKAKMAKSLWWSADYPDQQKLDNMEKLESFARSWVYDNMDILGKVPDEAFIKVLALEIATKYNSLFNIPAAQSIEIINVDARDIMRLIVADKAKVYNYYNFNLARFTLEQGGPVTVVFGALYTFILFITTLIKPLLMILLIILLALSVIGRKFILRQENKVLEGYMISCGCLLIINYIYALCLKMTISMADLGLPSVLNYLVAILVQIVYCIMLFLILTVCIKDWKNAGYEKYVQGAITIQGATLNAVANTKQSISNWREQRTQNRIQAIAAKTQQYANQNSELVQVNSYGAQKGVQLEAYENSLDPVSSVSFDDLISNEKSRLARAEEDEE